MVAAGFGLGEAGFLPADLVSVSLVEGFFGELFFDEVELFVAG